MPCLNRFAAALLLSAYAFAPPAQAQQQNLGHKALGSVGLYAGAQAEPGVYVADFLLYFDANTLRDREGRALPVGLDLDALGNAFGAAFVVKLPWLGTYYTLAASAPLSRVSINTTRPEASIDRAGLGDVFVQPFKVGWRWPRFDLVAAYALYLPTGQFTLRGNGGVGQGQVTHQFSLGGAVSFDAARRWHLSALSSFNLNEKKREVDITRGATIQIQGGLGRRLLPILDVGLAAYALWQVSDDRGSALPAALRGARDRVFGLGPEVALLVPAIRSRLTLRYMFDIAARSRPEGQLLLLDLTVVAWRPKQPS